ncbi:MAG: hypothetical protein KDE26_03505 [Bacteroidetes bacterium]|nr:hypothetical protein [Bacteroidota bacterium]MCB0842316.1 hypothetical protein [Bacteroidota bacterium]
MSPYEYDESSMIRLVIRISHSGANLDIELPLSTTGEAIVKHLIDQNQIPQRDKEGNPYVYELISRNNGKKLTLKKSLFDQKIGENDTLLLAPKLVAGK